MKGQIGLAGFGEAFAGLVVILRFVIVCFVLYPWQACAWPER